jgi:hypothetical protein
VESIKSPKNDPVNNGQHALSILGSLIPGDTIIVIEKKGKVSEMIYSEILENRLLGQIYIDPESFQMVEPYHYFIDTIQIRQVIMVPKSSGLGIGSKSNYYFHHLYKIKKGEKILIIGINGNQQYMHFEEFGEGLISGIPIYYGFPKANYKNWISRKEYKNLEKTLIEIPLREIENIHVQRLSVPGTIGASLGVGLLFVGMYYAIMNMDMGFAVWD